MFKCINCKREFKYSQGLAGHLGSNHECKKAKELYYENYLKENGDEIKKLYIEGYSPRELIVKFPIEKYSKPNDYHGFDIIYEYLKRENVYQKYEERYSNSKFVKRKLQNTQKTSIENWGVDNPSKNEEIKNKKVKDKENPFATYQFQILKYIKGQCIHPDENSRFEEYRRKINKITNKNKKKLEEIYDGICYYSGIKITRSKKADCNMLTIASIDHKISVLRGFEKNIPPEEIGDIKNLCWCAKIVNSIKGTRTEAEFANDGCLKRIAKISDFLNKKTEGTNED